MSLRFSSIARDILRFITQFKAFNRNNEMSMVDAVVGMLLLVAFRIWPHDFEDSASSVSSTVNIGAITSALGLCRSCRDCRAAAVGAIDIDAVSFLKLCGQHECMRVNCRSPTEHMNISDFWWATNWCECVCMWHLTRFNTLEIVCFPMWQSV